MFKGLGFLVGLVLLAILLPGITMTSPAEKGSLGEAYSSRGGLKGLSSIQCIVLHDGDKYSTSTTGQPVGGLYTTLTVPGPSLVGEYNAYIEYTSGSTTLKLEVSSQSYVTKFHGGTSFGRGWYVTVYLNDSILYWDGFLESESNPLNITLELWSNGGRIGFYNTSGFIIWIASLEFPAGIIDLNNTMVSVSSSNAVFNDYPVTLCLYSSRSDLPLIKPYVVFRLKTPLNPVVNQTIIFDAAGTLIIGDYPMYYLWDFNGDGLIDANTTLPEANYTYTQPGTYTLKLIIVFMNSGELSFIRNIHVNPYASVNVFNPVTNQTETLRLPGNESLLSSVFSLAGEGMGRIVSVDLSGSVIETNETYTLERGVVMISGGVFFYGGSSGFLDIGSLAALFMSSDLCITGSPGYVFKLKGYAGLTLNSTIVFKGAGKIYLFDTSGEPNIFLLRLDMFAGDNTTIIVSSSKTIGAAELSLHPLGNIDPGLIVSNLLFNNTVKLNLSSGGGRIILRNISYTVTINNPPGSTGSSPASPPIIRFDANASTVILDALPLWMINESSPGLIYVVKTSLVGELNITMNKIAQPNNPAVIVQKDGGGSSETINTTDKIILVLKAPSQTMYTVKITYKPAWLGGTPTPTTTTTTTLGTTIPTTTTPPPTTTTTPSSTGKTTTETSGKTTTATAPTGKAPQLSGNQYMESLLYIVIGVIIAVIIILLLVRKH